MNIVVVDSGRLAGEADFPEVDLPKFGWLQYPELEPPQVAEATWRSDVVISVATPIDRAVIDNAFKLRLIVVAGDDAGHVDLECAAERGITVCNTPGLDPADPAHAQPICDQVIANIDAYLRDEPVNRVGSGG